MNDKITTFLNSDLLEKYLVGTTTVAETATVETYLAKYPDVQNAYNTMQANLEIIAKSNSVEAPKHVLNAILDELDDQPVRTMNTRKKRKSWYSFAVAASITALLLAGTSYTFYEQNQKLNHENQTVVDELFDLRGDIDSNNKKLDAILAQFHQLNNPETEKYLIKGNDRAKDLKTVAYINPIDKTSFIDVVTLPQLPEEQCYQIWAEVQDKMVSLGILNKEDWQLKPISFPENALGLNITIEPKGGNTNASMENSVAEIVLQRKN